MMTALASAFLKKKIKGKLAMSGEITLRGKVLPVGGIKEKLLAAHRSGFKHVIIPQDNEADLQKLPDVVRDELTITLAATLQEVLHVAIPEIGTVT